MIDHSQRIERNRLLGLMRRTGNTGQPQTVASRLWAYDELKEVEAEMSVAERVVYRLAEAELNRDRQAHQ